MVLLPTTQVIRFPISNIIGFDVGLWFWKRYRAVADVFPIILLPRLQKIFWICESNESVFGLVWYLVAHDSALWITLEDGECLVKDLFRNVIWNVTDEQSVVGWTVSNGNVWMKRVTHMDPNREETYPPTVSRLLSSTPSYAYRPCSSSGRWILIWMTLWLAHRLIAGSASGRRIRKTMT